MGDVLRGILFLFGTGLYRVQWLAVGGLTLIL